VEASGRLGGRAALSLQPEAGEGSAGVSQLKALQDRLAAHFGQGGGALSGAFSLGNGRFAVEGLAVRADGATAEGRIAADLEADSLDAALSVTAAGEAEPYLELEARGRIDRPDVRTGGSWISGRASAR
jgi:hypothetical protein